MSSDREWFFGMLDSHTREQYGCFVAEMFLNDDQSKYVLCFRSERTVSAGQYACCYLEVGVEDVKASHEDKALTKSIVDTLRRLESL